MSRKFLHFFLVSAIVHLGFQPLGQYAPSSLPADFGTGHYPQDYFASPVAYPIKLTGTFGELRTNHFHSGIDIKSPNGKTGAPIFAAAEGYIYRIKIQAGGYGNALYIKHPNGYTTVYAHLETLRDDVARYVKSQQYEKESFEVNLYPAKGRFPVNKGQQIGTLGNSGSSSGPHLHFEIRHSGSDKALNPLLFNLPVPDKDPPSLRGMKTYVLDDQLQVLKEQSFELIKFAPGKYKLSKDTIRIAGWRAGFGVKAYDSMTGFENDNGIYALTLMVNDQVIYHYRMEQLDFDETRYINAHIDFAAKMTGKGYFQRCFRQPGDKLNNYSGLMNEGVVTISSEQATKIEIIVVDAHKNSSSLMFHVLRDPNESAPPSIPYHYYLPWTKENLIELADFKLEMPKGCLYHDLQMQFSSTPDISFGSYSSVYHIHQETAPVHKYFRISLLGKTLPRETRNKAFIAVCSDGKPQNCGGSWDGDWISTRVREFGDYCIMLDTEPPTITPLQFQENMRGKYAMTFRIKDNFQVAGLASGLRYRATVDNKWILMEYDSKNDKLTHVFDEKIGPGEHQLKLIVTDDRGNQALFERTFQR